MYKTILFDVDGTLIHSQPGIIHTMEYTFAQMGVDVSGVDLTKYLGPPLRQSFGNHFSTEEEIEKATLIYRDYYREQGAHQCTLYPGCREMLERLYREGFTLCTATCKPTAVVTPILEEQGILQYFKIVGGASMDKSVDNKTAVIRSVLDQLGSSEGVLMVGDRRDDGEGAANNGLLFLGALYGYGSKDELAPYHPIYCADNCSKIAEYIGTTK